MVQHGLEIQKMQPVLVTHVYSGAYGRLRVTATNHAIRPCVDNVRMHESCADRSVDRQKKRKKKHAQSCADSSLKERKDRQAHERKDR